MSLLDFDSMSPEDIIAHYILEGFNKGAFLNYNDYSSIRSWLEQSDNDVDFILSLLEEFIEKKKPQKKRTLTLKYVDKFIQDKISQSKSKF